MICNVNVLAFFFPEGEIKNTKYIQHETATFNITAII